jgi:hypothetical protein
VIGSSAFRVSRGRRICPPNSRRRRSPRDRQSAWPACDGRSDAPRGLVRGGLCRRIVVCGGGDRARRGSRALAQNRPEGMAKTVGGCRGYGAMSPGNPPLGSRRWGRNQPPPLASGGSLRRERRGRLAILTGAGPSSAQRARAPVPRHEFLGIPVATAREGGPTLRPSLRKIVCRQHTSARAESQPVPSDHP